ncbi:hypothetical protein EV144_102746 [Flavobacterium sp. 270]|uniref:hypothetical protein n=1 Tax=Flavobacterium sp. 270 TaxID=2512114 RepID=UPI0010650BA7|nr:hypothetical protein [Flavobacterium sp. 270]TDW50307.1 hypothetical protein EV144_102746 [Flavobacterium sp. 270]
MIKTLKPSLFVSFIVLILAVSCKDSKTTTKTDNTEVVDLKEVPEVEETAVEVKQEPTAFIPKNCVPFDTIYGDLNKDGVEDLVYMIKGTDKSKIITHEYRGQLDRNRRGLIILFNTKNGYKLAAKNYDCFSSENEDGGVYYAPELSIEIDKGKLFVSYAHGRYGYWSYTFKHQNNDFELIGYDGSSNRGPIVLSDVSINFLTRQKIVNQNVNENTYDGDEIFEKTTTKIRRTQLIKLSEIKDFDELDFSDE